MKKILSIDGGGIRGIIPAMVLMQMEEQLGKPVAAAFDLLAGTSTGGILALGLTKPGRDGLPALSAAHLAEIYLKRGKEIFPKNPWENLKRLRGLNEEMYPQTPLESVLREYLGGSKLSEATSEVLVTAYDIERRDPVFFKRHKARSEASRDYYISHVARATSAAPTYFEPAPVTNITGSVSSYLVDGGVFANNPAQCAVAEAMRLWPEEKDFLVVSLGTGQLTRPIMYNDAKSWGKVGWVRPLLDVMFDGVSDTVDYQLAYDFPPKNGQRRYFRLQCVLDEGNDDMDDASATNLRALRYKAEKMLEDQRASLGEMVELLR